MKFEIKNRLSGELIIEVKAESWRFAVELAIKQKANLSCADLSYANLSRANLSYADLSGADLSYADLSGANLSYANLSYADLSYANLLRADLSGANLLRADLSGVNLSYANLSYADLVIFQYQRNWAYFTLDGTLRIGCKALPISEWLETYEQIGRAENYTKTQIEMYGMFIKQCKVLFDRENPK